MGTVDERSERRPVRLAELAELERLFPQGVRGKRIHAVGAGGHGISAGLLIAQAAGAIVTGCDRAPSSLATMLEQSGIPIAFGHDNSHIAEADLVVTNPAVTFLFPNHAELEAAESLDVPVAQWQPLLGLLMRGSVGVSVAGVHGKGSTTALLGAMLIAAGKDPTVEVGEMVCAWDSNVRLGKGRLFVNEADEFNYNFLSYHPRVVTLTEVEYDHPEFFGSYAEIRDAFVRFLAGMDTTPGLEDAPPPTIVTSADSPGCRDTLARLGPDWPGVVRTFSVEGSQADAMAHDVRTGAATSFEFILDGRSLGRVTQRAPGRHNVANAMAAAATASALGVAPEVIARTISEFDGLRRRFEIIEDGDVTWVDDYAHHPHAVALTIAAARQRFPGRRIVAVFQPTLYTRLKAFLTPFAEALAAGDEVVVVEIQPSREHDTGLIHGSHLVDAVRAQPAFVHRPDAARYGGDFSQTAAALNALRQPGDVLLIMGSGPVNQVIALARTIAQ
ncbi:MAG: UDP-N-acetylmuramate--L-alanine ligase [Chloroflexota bacterium]|nr:UDP-N-acetylmuramate--L-alanine ligase [Chloroflexota bacterium]